MAYEFITYTGDEDIAGEEYYRLIGVCSQYSSYFSLVYEKPSKLFQEIRVNMKKVLFSLLLLIWIFILSPANIFAIETNRDENLKENYNDIYTIDNDCKPLFHPDTFAVDSDGNIYIHNMLFHKVQVYKNNKFLYSYKISDYAMDGSIYIKTDKDNNIYFSLVKSRMGIKINNKQLIEVVDNFKNNSDYPNDNYELSHCEDIYGNTYNMHNILGYNYITKTTSQGIKSTVYSIPISHFVLKLFLLLLVIGFIFIVYKISSAIKK